MKFTHRLWIHNKDLQRFRKYTPLQVFPYERYGQILTARFNLDGQLTLLKNGFVLGEIVDVGNPIDRGVLFIGNTQYPNDLVTSNTKPSELNGRDFVSLKDSLEQPLRSLIKNLLVDLI